MGGRKPEKRSGIVTLITDFGTEAEYAGALKGAVLSANPRCRVVDITHRIPSRDIARASYVLKHSYRFFPPGTVHLAVVDPGVGTVRRPVVIVKGDHFFVGPDNGVFTGVLETPGESKGFEIAAKEFCRTLLSPTFHGRDLFGPVAGRLSAGRSPERTGPPVFDFIRIEEPRPEWKGRRLAGRVLWVDPFGNLVTNITREDYGPALEKKAWRIARKGREIGVIRKTYGEGRPGKPMALFGSTGHLELAVNQGRASEILGLGAGDPVIILFE